MRYLFKYKLFEASDYHEIKLDLNDILLEIEEFGYLSKIDTYSNIVDKKLIQIDISIYCDNYLDLNDIKGCVERIIHYMKLTNKFYNPKLLITYWDDYRGMKSKEIDKLTSYQELDILEIKLKFKII